MIEKIPHLLILKIDASNYRERLIEEVPFVTQYKVLGYKI